MKPRSKRTVEQPAVTPQLAIPVDAVLSFLKDMKGALTWTPQDLRGVLKLSCREEINNVLALLEAQGYVKSAAGDDWMITPAGESVSGARAPRFTRASVAQAVEELKKRIEEANRDSKAAFKIAQALAFGDFLLADRARVQAAEVGVELVPKTGEPGAFRSAADARVEQKFLIGLRGGSALLHVKAYQKWMGMRTCVALL